MDEAPLTYPDVPPPTRAQTETFYKVVVGVLNHLLTMRPKANGLAFIEGPDRAPDHAVDVLDIPGDMWAGAESVPRVACWLAEITGARQVAVACEMWIASLEEAGPLRTIAEVEAAAMASPLPPSQRPDRQKVMMIMIYGPGFQIMAMPALDESGPHPVVANEPLPEHTGRVGGKVALKLPEPH